MKTAIIFTGFVRSYNELGHRLHEKLFQAFTEYDLYYCTWDVVDSNNNEKISQNIFLNNDACKGIQILNWNLYKDLIPKTIKNQRENDIFNTNRFAISEGINASDRIRNQWFLVNESKKLIPSNYYDNIVRCRFDLNITNFIFDNNPNKLTIPYNFYSVHYAKNADVGPGYCDHFAYGNEKNMNIYLSMYENIDIMYQNDNVNISHAEGLLKYYLTKKANLDIKFNNNIQYQIIKNMFDIDDTPLKKYEIQ